MSELAILKLPWPDRWCCYVCRRDGRARARAVIRILSGVYGGGGYAACRDHVSQAETESLRPLLERPLRVATGYRVVAHAVIADEHDDPLFGRKLWIATAIEPARGELGGECDRCDGSGQAWAGHPCGGCEGTGRMRR